jgi:hypothetical protein
MAATGQPTARLAGTIRQRCSTYISVLVTSQFGDASSSIGPSPMWYDVPVLGLSTWGPLPQHHSYYRCHWHHTWQLQKLTAYSSALPCVLLIMTKPNQAAIGERRAYIPPSSHCCRCSSGRVILDCMLWSVVAGFTVSFQCSDHLHSIAFCR